jgi:hypothetical protein
MREYIKDGNGHTVGCLLIESNGDQSIENTNGYFLGRYNSRWDRTEDRNGGVIGSGNQLMRLLR